MTKRKKDIVTEKLKEKLSNKMELLNQIIQLEKQGYQYDIAKKITLQKQIELLERRIKS